MDDAEIIRDWRELSILSDNLKNLITECNKSGIFKELNLERLTIIRDYSAALFREITKNSILSDFLSLRSWILFIIEFMKKVSESDVSSKLDISRMAGEAITKMGFLPDSRLFSKRTKLEKRLKNEKLEKRLLRNANISLRRNPSTGREVELEKILEQVDKFVERFDPNGDLAKKFSISDPGPISESMKNYIESWSLNLESDVEYELWDELFKSRKPAKLGEQVRAEIEQWSSDVEDEFMTSPIEFFDEMNVEQGLNDKEATSAIKFIDHPQIRYVVGGDGIRLINVLESATRNRVIKLANSRVDKSKDGLYAFLRLSMELSPKRTSQDKASFSILFRVHLLE